MEGCGHFVLAVAVTDEMRTGAGTGGDVDLVADIGMGGRPNMDKRVVLGVRLVESTMSNYSGRSLV